MAGIRSSRTQPETIIRRGLHSRGFRFRVNVSSVPGTPDLLLPKWDAVILVHGCFWHGHTCHLFKMPNTRTEFWSGKIDRNKARDKVVCGLLDQAGWRHLTIWECALKGKARWDIDALLTEVSNWIVSHGESAEISGLPVKSAPK